MAQYRVRHSSVSVRHSSLGCGMAQLVAQSGCCKAAPSSNLGSAPQWRTLPDLAAMKKLERNSTNVMTYE
jgi:hypothetical protein